MTIKPALLLWHGCAALLFTITSVMIYVSVQQQYRGNANDPQVQLAEDLSARLHDGKPVETLFPADSIDLERSLSVFAVFYDAAGRPLRSSALLEGVPPRLPPGVLAAAVLQGEHSITWQPRPGIRMAMVIVCCPAAPVAFVAAGRSLRLVEERVAALGKIIGLCWLAGMVIIVIHGIIRKFLITAPGASPS